MKQLLLLLYFCLVNVQASTLQDPTRPNKLSFNIGSDSVVLLPSALKLTAIISSNQNKAIINRKSVIEGQQVQGYKVILISRNHVILSGSEGNQKLFVNNYYVKKAANNDF